MPLTEDQADAVESLRTHVEEMVRGDDRYGDATRLDREDQSTLATRFEVGSACWLELAIRPFVPQIRVGFLTNDRWKSEEIEQAILDSGDSMAENVELGFSDAGLDWDEPPVEHYRDPEGFFYFATPLAVDEVFDFETADVQGKVLRMLEGYFLAFGALTGPAEDEEDDLDDEEDED
jgi:hypothetical protein